MIKYKQLICKDFLELYYTLLREEKEIPYGIFPSHDVFYSKAALELKFQRPFSFKEVRDIIKDLSWQHTSPQPKKDLKGEPEC